MVRPVRRCPMSQSQQEGAEESETNPNVPQHVEQPYATENEVIEDYNLEVDYEGSDPDD